jgi:hypothetical protein
MRNISEDEEEQGPGSWIAADKDLVLLPKDPSTIEDAIEALENKDNYGIYLSNIRSGKVTPKNMEDFFGPTSPAAKKKIEKDTGVAFPIKTKAAIDDFIKSRAGKPNLVYYEVVGDTLMFPNSKNTSKGRTQSIVSTIMDNAGVKYEIKQKESFGESKNKKVALKENPNEPKPKMSDEELMKRIKSSLSNQVSGGKKGKPGLQEGPIDKRLAIVFLKYRGKSFPMDYKTGSMFARFVGDLEKTGAFMDEDAISDFMSSDDFYNYANKFSVEIEEPIDNDMLSLAPKKQMEPQDLIPGRAQGDVNPNAPHRMSDLFEKMKKTGKLKKSELTEIIKKFK